MKALTATSVLILFSVLLHVVVVVAQDEPDERPVDLAIEDAEPDTTILFPWFTEALGVIVFFILSRYLEALPYTAVMFVIGMAMGMGAERTLSDDLLTTSILQWTQIDSEVLLIVFLPGLTFPDAFGLNVHLFLTAFWQVINFAFPMVLAGTALTALVAFFLFPYGWSFNLAMTFGAILSATDPAAVAALMSSLGAPPRLQIHIGGESMLNDGSSYVFYFIFSAMFLTELGIDGVGENYNLGRGVAIFFREAFGAAAFGIAFGLGLVFFLYKLNRKLNDDENIVQIVATITVAYLAYYTADVSGCSGVISVVSAGVTAKAYGNSMINKPDMMDSFWGLVGQLLNTLLFTLAGVVWGAILGDSTGEGVFKAKDWGFLFMNYIFLTLFRYFLLFAFYPVTKRIGLGTDWQETVFSGFAGLRGGVGISLALSLYNQVFEATADVDGTDDGKYQTQVTQLFAQVGGIVFLTLVVNGTLAGPLLTKLGLAKSSNSRVRLLNQLKKHLHKHGVDSFVKLLADPRFTDVEFPVVQKHVPFLKNLTVSELKAACERNPKYKPSLENILPYMDTSGQDLSWANTNPSEVMAPDVVETVPEAASSAPSDKDSKEDLTELRHFFLEVLSTVYNKQLEDGELDGRSGFLSGSLLQSIDMASSDVDKGLPLDDWKAAHAVDKALHSIESSGKVLEYCCTKKSKRSVGDDRAHSMEYKGMKLTVLRALSFIEAHRQARTTFSKNLSDSSVVDANEQVVLDESKAEMDEAQKELDQVDKDDVLIVKTHYFCVILLNKAAGDAEHLCQEGVLMPKETSQFLSEIDQDLISANNCSVMDSSPDEEVKKMGDSAKPSIEPEQPEKPPSSDKDDEAKPPSSDEDDEAKPSSSDKDDEAKHRGSVWDDDQAPSAEKRGSLWA